MTTTASLIEEARKLDAAATPPPWRISEGRVVQTSHITRDVWTIPHVDEDMTFILRARTLLPQLADALVAAGTNCRALQDLYEEKRVALVAAEARLAKVREMAIIEEEFPSGYIGKRCLLCKGAWRYSAIEAHSDPVCPARPMEPTT